MIRKSKWKGFPNYLSGVETLSKGSVRLYRGQIEDKPLLPKIARKNPDEDTTSQERKMLNELRRRGSLLLGPNKQDDWDLMVYAQHFGMVTRLLDWTSNPLVGLWFACKDRKASLSGYVYVFQVTDELLLDKKKDEGPFAHGPTRVFMPNLNNYRIVAQAGWFTTHRYSHKVNRFVSLEDNVKTGNLLSQIEIPGKEKDGILFKLDALGINSQTLFPDLEGLCHHINWVHDF